MMRDLELQYEISTYNSKSYVGLQAKSESSIYTFNYLEPKHEANKLQPMKNPEIYT